MNWSKWLCAALLITPACPSASAGRADSGRIFQHPEGFFTVEVPQGWTTEAGDLVFRFRKGDFLVKLVVQPAPDHLEFAKVWTNQALAGLRDVRKAPGTEMAWGGAEGGRYDLYGGVSASGESRKIEVLSTSDGRRSYVMVLSGPAQLWDALGNEWRSFVYNFTVCSIPGSNCSAEPGKAPSVSPPASGTAASKRPAAFPTAGGSMFRDPKQRFQVEVPVDWSASPTGDGAVLSRGGAYANVLVFEGAQPSRHVVETLADQVGKQWQNFREVEGGESALAGLRSDFSVCTGTNPRGAPALLKVVAATGQRYTYTMIISAPQAELGALQRDLSQIERTFSLGGSPPQPSAAVSARQATEQTALRPAPLQTRNPAPPTRPSLPDTSVKPFQGNGFRVAIPANWKRFPASSDLLYWFSTDDAVRPLEGGITIALGMIAGYTPAGAGDLRASTDRLIRKVVAENPGTRLSAAPRQQVMVGGLPAESSLLEGQSALTGEPEVTWLVTAFRPQGLFHMMLVCPREDFSNLRAQFGRIVSSIRFD